jgi:hypothetical protein
MSPSLSDEHRRFTRIIISMKAMVQTEDQNWPTELLDLSLKGALFNAPPGWSGRKGEKATLHVVMGEGVGIHMEGEIAHIENNHAGLVCQHIDVDSVAHLRRLVELNLGDDSQLHRELAAMINLP